MGGPSGPAHRRVRILVQEFPSSSFRYTGSEPKITVMGTFCSHCKRREDEAGFTLVEMMIALFIGAFAFTALAAYLAGGLKVLSTQKTRTQANELATQAIEDLQRLDDEYIGFCTAAPASLPAGFTAADWVKLPHCPSNTLVQDPCTAPAAPTAPANLAPDEEYTCRRVNITYTVKRYVAWASAAKTDKKISVRVSWTNDGRSHEVVQETTRALTPPPTITGGFINNTAAAVSITLAGNSLPVSGLPVDLKATATGLAASDNVRANFTYLGPSNVPQTISVSLVSTDGLTWTGSIATFQLPLGKQYVFFTGVRLSDKKEGSGGVVQLETGCTTSPCPPGPSGTSPVAISAPSVNPTSPDADSAGALVSSSLTIKATTTNTTANGSPASVTALVPMSGGGTKSVGLARDNASCFTTCTWTAVVEAPVAGAKGFRFSSTGSPKVRVTAVQRVQHGTTAVADSSTVVFQ